jgi:hypothetical protein
MKRDDYSFGIDENALTEVLTAPGINYEMPNDAVYTSAAYNDDTNTESNCSGDKDSAVIIVQHNPDNDKSHIKQITVQLIGSDGVVKAYTFTVDVYQ